MEVCCCDHAAVYNGKLHWHMAECLPARRSLRARGSLEEHLVRRADDAVCAATEPDDFTCRVCARPANSAWLPVGPHPQLMPGNAFLAICSPRLLSPNYSDRR